jgi:dynein heavy chain
MKRAVHGLSKEALMAYPKNSRTSWILQWPSQLVLNCSQAS